VTRTLFRRKGKNLMEASAQVEPVDNDAPVATTMPEPTGYKILIALPDADEKTDGGIIKVQSTREQEETGSIVGFVLKVGPDAFKDPKRFPSGAYCKEGDFILMRSYSGTRFRIHGKEFRLISDDSIEAVVQDPRGIVKV
jgi:co-chaperonin GroES (HSP10)